MSHLDLFSGIGGFALATEMVWDDVEHIFCDNDPFSQAILKKHWPNSIIYGDIRQLTTDPDRERELQPEGSLKAFREWVGDGIDLLTGGFPCQPFSAAGRRRGTEDDRHLWPEMLRVIRETNPTYILGENVGGFLTWNGGLVFEQVCADLEAEGYEVCPLVIPAAAVNAPHRRDRVWIAAFNPEYARRNSTKDREGDTERGDCDAPRTHEDEQFARPDLSRDDASDTANCGREYGEGERRISTEESGSGETTPATHSYSWSEDWPEVAARFCIVDDGLPNGLARPRGWRNAALKGAGNAIVPQVAAEIMRAMRLNHP